MRIRFLFTLPIALATAAAAADGSIDVLPLPRSASAEVSIDISQRTARVGDYVELSFSATSDGYLSVWSHGSSGKFTRLFPNQFATEARITGGVSYGVGGAEDSYGVRVDGPPGMEEIYAIWTADADAQPTPSEATTRGIWKAVARGGEQVAALARLEIADPSAGGTNGRSSARAVGTSRVWAVVAAANTSELLHADDDARAFAAMLENLYGDRLQLRVLPSATGQEFLAAVDWLGAVSQPGDRVYVYFSGAGGEASDGREVLDMMPVAGASTLSEGEFSHAIEKVRASDIRVLIDASFGVQPRDGIAYTPVGARPRSREGIDHRGNGFDAPDNASTLLAASEGGFALETPAGGVLTRVYLARVRELGAENFDLLARDVARIVSERTQRIQTPVFHVEGHDD